MHGNFQTELRVQGGKGRGREGGRQTDKTLILSEKSMVPFSSCPTPVSGCHLAETDASLALEIPMLVNVTESLNG